MTYWLLNEVFAFFSGIFGNFFDYRRLKVLWIGFLASLSEIFSLLSHQGANGKEKLAFLEVGLLNGGDFSGIFPFLAIFDEYRRNFFHF